MQKETVPVKIISGFLHLLFPVTCPVCRKPSDHFRTAPVCSSCWSRIQRHGGKGCKRCAAVAGFDPGARCQECRALKPRFERVLAYGIYEGALKEIIHSIKFGRIKRLATVLGMELLKLDLPAADCIVPVPLSAQGLRNREFNQAALMAKAVARGKAIPLLPNGLIKVRETFPQAMLSQEKRKENVKGAYRAHGDVRGMRVLLVDDVVTTGTTANECARELKKAGAASVVVLAAARASY